MRNILWFLVMAAVLGSCTGNGTKEVYKENPVVHPTTPYLGAQKCKECHASSYLEWKQSDHFYSMQKATDQFVRGDFNTTFSADEMDYRFFTEDSTYQVEVTELGKTKKYRVAYTFGWHPLQQYLVATENGRFQTLRASWDTDKNRWFHQNSGTIVEPHDWLSWSKGGQNWNTMCSSCHSTHVQKNYDQEKDSFRTTYQEINVACESCHGPGRGHLLAIESNEKDPYADLLSATHQQKTDNCATCHARRTMLEDSGDPSMEFLSHYFPQSLNTAFYEPDGQIKEEDFVYGSFLSSKMHRNHVTCINCHHPHTGKLKKEGNNLCLQCHDQSYTASSHTHHSENSEGAQCINCHMDGKYFMGNDYRRDHSFRIPRPDQSVKYGTSNACNSCHTDKDPKWASKNVVNWFGTDRAYHFSDDLIPGAAGEYGAMNNLKSLLANDSVPEIIRATVIDYLKINTSIEVSQLIIDALSDKEPLVRLKAFSSLMYFPENYRTQYGMIGIKDEIKSVRIVAFRSVIGVDPLSLSPEMEQIWENVHAEYLEYLKTNADFPSGQLLIGEYYMTIGQTNQAINAYFRALKMDSLQLDAYTNLTILYSGQDQAEKASLVLDMAIRVFPNHAEFYYFIGLNEGALGNDDAQIQNLKRAFEIAPKNPKYAYNYILLLHQSGQQKEANNFLNSVLKTQPNNPKFLELKKYFSLN